MLLKCAYTSHIYCISILFSFTPQDHHKNCPHSALCELCNTVKLDQMIQLLIITCLILLFCNKYANSYVTVNKCFKQFGNYAVKCTRILKTA